jgi:hypothetical protein
MRDVAVRTPVPCGLGDAHGRGNARQKPNVARQAHAAVIHQGAEPLAAILQLYEVPGAARKHAITCACGRGAMAFTHECLKSSKLLPGSLTRRLYAPGFSDSLTNVRHAALAAGPVQAMRQTPIGARAKSTDEPLRGDSPVSPTSSADCTASVAQCNQSYTPRAKQNENGQGINEQLSDVDSKLAGASQGVVRALAYSKLGKVPLTCRLYGGVVVTFRHCSFLNSKTSYKYKKATLIIKLPVSLARLHRPDPIPFFFMEQNMGTGRPFELTRNQQ